MIALGVNTRTDRPEVATDSWKCVAAIAQFYGYPNVPDRLGHAGQRAAARSDDFITPCAALASANTAGAGRPSRSTARRSPRSPTGASSSSARATRRTSTTSSTRRRTPYSPLDGTALVAQKVKELVMMGGGYPSREGENNFEGDAGAAQRRRAELADEDRLLGLGGGLERPHRRDRLLHAPCQLAGSRRARGVRRREPGDRVLRHHRRVPRDRPERREPHRGGPRDQRDRRPTGPTRSRWGPGNEYYLLLGDATRLEASIEALWDTLPGTTHQTITFTSTPPSPATLGGTYVPTASGGVTGNPVTLTIDAASTSGCTINASGVVALSLPAGSCILDANEPGDTTYAPGVAHQTFRWRRSPRRSASPRHRRPAPSSATPTR